MLNRLIEPLNLVLERPFLVLFRSIFGAGTSTFGAGNFVLENAYLVLDRGLSSINEQSRTKFYIVFAPNDDDFASITNVLAQKLCC